MSNVFLWVLNMSITASYIAVAVVMLRFVLKKAPKWIMGVLWGFVALRLVFPFSFESVFSLIPSAKPLPDDILTSETPRLESGIQFFNNRVNPILQESLSPNISDSVNPLQVITFIAAVIWIFGVAAMLIYTLISFLRVKSRVKEAVLLCGNIYLCEKIATPFILGVIKPKIYLPFSMSDNDRKLVIAHEKAHLKRCDHLWKPFGFLLLSVYWFNLVLWLAYVLLCRDIELACDEKVIKEMGSDIKKSYSEALINCSMPRKMITACPLAFGEVGVKERVKGILNYKKPAFWVIVAAGISVIITAVCLLTNPKGDKLSSIESHNFKAENYVAVWYGDIYGYRQNYDFKQNDLEEFLNLRISKNEVSKNRSDDRDKAYVLVIQSEEETIPSISSYLEGTYFCFNDDFTEVWVSDSVKPTLSYRVKNPEKARKVFNKLCNRNGIDFELKDFLDDETVKRISTKENENGFFTADYEIMKITETKNEVKLYMWVYNGVYIFKNGELIMESGSHIPTVVTASKNGKSYSLKEYWIPRDGNLYAKDIRQKFPLYLWYNATDSQWCVDAQSQRCEQAALKYFTQNGAITENVQSIVDESENNPDATFDTALEEIYRDDEYVYYFNVIKSQYVIVTYTDGSIETVDVALKSEKITLTDLDRFGIKYQKQRINGVLKFYSSSVKEGQQPASFTISELTEADVQTVIKELKAAKWVSDAVTDRLPYKFEGMLFYEKEIHFNLSEGFAYCDENFAKLPEKTLEILSLYRDYISSNSRLNKLNRFDTVNFDIDGDGENEQCDLTIGPTSGLFTFSFIVTSQDKSTEFYNTFMIPPSALSFKVIDGKLKIESIVKEAPKGSIKRNLYDISFKDGNIVLTNGGKAADYWGEQGKHPSKQLYAINLYL